jgi:hypothetical protein
VKDKEEDAYQEEPSCRYLYRSASFFFPKGVLDMGLIIVL